MRQVARADDQLARTRFELPVAEGEGEPAFGHIPELVVIGVHVARRPGALALPDRHARRRSGTAGGRLDDDKRTGHPDRARPRGGVSSGERQQLLERPHVRRIAQLTDPLQRLQPLVATACDVTSRLAPLYEIVRSSATDEQVRDLLDRHEDQRWSTLRAFVALIEANLPPDLTPDEATDRLYALLSHEMYWLLVRKRRWSATRWRDHVTRQAHHQLLPEQGN